MCRESRSAQIEIRNEPGAFLEQINDRDCFQQPEMKRIAANGFAPLKRLSRQSPAVSVWRSQNRRFQIWCEDSPKDDPDRRVRRRWHGSEILKPVRL